MELAEVTLTRRRRQEPQLQGNRLANAIDAGSDG